MDRSGNATRLIGRRSLLQGGALFLGAASSAELSAFELAKPSLRVGLVTDLHYADKPTVGTRHYRETHAKLEEAVGRLQQSQLDFVVELGDFIDAADSADAELKYLRTINQLFSKLPCKRHYVLGNHCVDMLTKPEFLGGVEQTNSYYSFDHQEVHFIVLDACFRSDGQPYGRKSSHWLDANVPAMELEWLTADCAATSFPIIVFAHQRLDETKQHSTKNNKAIRQILEASKKVLAVFQGHSHQNDYQQIAGIHYCTLAAMVEGAGPESNGYATLEFFPDSSIRVSGFRRQKTYEWGKHNLSKKP